MFSSRSFIVSGLTPFVYACPWCLNPFFAFEWEDPAEGTKQQLTWTRPPEEFKNSTTIFGEALASDLDSFQPENFSCWLLQYMDDLILAAENGENCWEGTKALLELLMMSGYWVLKKKGTDLQRGGKIFGVCSERRHDAIRPVQKRDHFENPTTKNQRTGRRVLGCHWVL